MMGGVYCIKNTVTGERYVGTTRSLARRERKHWLDLKAGRNQAEALQGSYDRHGRDAFIFEILESWDDDCKDTQKELDWIHRLKPEFNASKPWLAPVHAGRGMAIGEAVRKDMNRQGLTAYRLVQSLKGKRPKGNDVPAATVYGFLRGDSPINSDDLGLIFEVLGWRLPPKDAPKRRTEK